MSEAKQSKTGAAVVSIPLLPDADDLRRSFAKLDQEARTRNRAVPLNIRKARAGLLLLSTGRSLKQCLIAAGFSRATARNSTQSGLSAEACLAEAAKLDPTADTRTLVTEARRAALRQLRTLRTMPERDLVRFSGAVGKLWDIAERWHGRGAEMHSELIRERFEDRAVRMSSLLAELQRRGIIGGGVAHGTASHDPVRVLDVSALASAPEPEAAAPEGAEDPPPAPWPPSAATDPE